MMGVGRDGPRGPVRSGRRDAAAEIAKAGDGAAARPPSSHWAGLDIAALDPARERPYWLALAVLPGVGQIGFARLLTNHGSAEAAWRVGDAALRDLTRVDDRAAAAMHRLRRQGVLAVARRIERATAAAGGRVVTALDDGYPVALRRLDPRPPVLYLAGESQALDAPCVAIVGTRRASGYGRGCATEIADELARAGVTVISGLALGIDGDAHRGALAAGGRSVAVLPAPLDRIYPPRHRELAGQLVAGGGMLISELAAGQPVGKPDFARRNRVIAGLAEAVVVVEAPDRSGALLTASAAIAHGRDLYAVPGPIDAVASRGCNRLIADHDAAIVTSPVALLHQLGVRRGPLPTVVASLSEAEALVLARLLERSASIEELMGPTRLTTGALAGSLTLLEARGLVASYGGATFHPTLAARRMARAV